MADDQRQKHVQFLLRILQAAQMGDDQALQLVKQHRESFKRALPVLEEHLRASTPRTQVSDEDLVRSGVPREKLGEARAAGSGKGGIDTVIDNVRQLVNPGQDKEMVMAPMEVTARPRPVPKVTPKPQPTSLPTPAPAPTPAPPVSSAPLPPKPAPAMDEAILASAGKAATPEQAHAISLLKTVMTLGGKPLK
jgi:hypothetical protein